MTEKILNEADPIIPQEPISQDDKNAYTSARDRAASYTNRVKRLLGLTQDTELSNANFYIFDDLLTDAYVKATIDDEFFEKLNQFGFTNLLQAYKFRKSDTAKLKFIIDGYKDKKVLLGEWFGHPELWDRLIEAFVFTCNAFTYFANPSNVSSAYSNPKLLNPPVSIEEFYTTDHKIRTADIYGKKFTLEQAQNDSAFRTIGNTILLWNMQEKALRDQEALTLVDVVNKNKISASDSQDAVEQKFEQIRIIQSNAKSYVPITKDFFNNLLSIYQSAASDKYDKIISRYINALYREKLTISSSVAVNSLTLNDYDLINKCLDHITVNIVCKQIYSTDVTEIKSRLDKQGPNSNTNELTTIGDGLEKFGKCKDTSNVKSVLLSCRDLFQSQAAVYNRELIFFMSLVEVYTQLINAARKSTEIKNAVISIENSCNRLIGVFLPDNFNPTKENFVEFLSDNVNICFKFYALDGQNSISDLNKRLKISNTPAARRNTLPKDFLDVFNRLLNLRDNKTEQLAYYNSLPANYQIALIKNKSITII